MADDSMSPLLRPAESVLQRRRCPSVAAAVVVPLPQGALHKKFTSPRLAARLRSPTLPLQGRVAIARSVQACVRTKNARESCPDATAYSVTRPWRGRVAAEQMRGGGVA